MHSGKMETTWCTVCICALIACIGLFLCSMCSPLFPINIWGDANCLLTVGRLMKAGGVLYRDIYEQKGPLLYLIHMCAAVITESSFFGVFLFEVAAFTLVLLFAKKLMRLWTGELLSWVGTVLYGACVLVSEAFARGDSAEEFCLPFLMFALYIVCSHAKNDDGVLPEGKLFILGVLAGCVATIKYTALGMFVGLCLADGIFLLMQRNMRAILKSAFAFLLGMLLAVLPWVLYFGVNKALRDAYTVYIYNNIFLYHGAARTLFDVGREILIAGIQNISWSLPALTGVLFLCIDRTAPLLLRCIVFLGALMAGAAVFLPGTVYPYYPLVLCTFAPLLLAIPCGRAKCIGKNRYVLLPFAVCVSLIAVVQFSPNAFLRGIALEDTAQGKLAARMEPGASLLQYSHLDDGLYLTHGVLPEEKYFARLNVGYQDMRDALDEAVREGRPDYVLVSWRELPQEFEGYALVAQETGYDDRNRLNKSMHLYRRKE